MRIEMAGGCLYNVGLVIEREKTLTITEFHVESVPAV